jgi:GNAT superfamily N-acetyltransferase
MGIGTALVKATLAWAREQKEYFCSLDYHPASLVSARFWEGCGFRPVRYGLLRGIDERVVSSGLSNTYWAAQIEEG